MLQRDGGHFVLKDSVIPEKKTGKRIVSLMWGVKFKKRYFTIEGTEGSQKI